METLSNSNTNIYTYIRGTVGDIKNGRNIILYKHSSGQERISITNLDKKLQQVIDSGEFVTLERENPGDKYIYSKIDSNSKALRNIGFNTIIYLSSTDKNTAVGYSEFLSTQGIIPNTVYIEVNLSSEVTVNKTEEGEVIGCDIVNIFTNIKDFSFLNEKLISDELFGYTTISKVYQNLNQIEVYPRYTQEISSLIEKPKETSILLNNGLIRSIEGGVGLYKLNLIKEMTIAEGFEKYQLGYYRGEIVIYAWKNTNQGVEYFLSSLSRKDKFGNPVIYTNTTTRTKLLSSTKPVRKLNYFAGKYASVVVYDDTKKKEYNSVINIETGELLNEVSPNYVIDLWNPYSHIIELPELISNSRLVDNLPELRNLYLDLKNYNNPSIKLVKRIGDWFVFRETAKNLDSSNNSVTLNYLIYTNSTKTVRICEEYDKEPIIINNNLLLLNTNTTLDGKSYNYNTYYSTDGEYCSENYLMARDIIAGKDELGTKRYSKSLECIIYGKLRKISSVNNTTIWVEQDAENYQNYKNKRIQLDHIGDNIQDSYIIGFRRKSCADNLKVPEIIGAINGLVYYKEGNKIKLL